MLDAIKPLLDNGIINEDTRIAISEAWEARLSEAKEEVRAELREEFAQRYQHDKQVMVEALDKMVTESLTAELQEFADEKQKLAEDRVKFKRTMVEGADKFNNFMVSKLAEEIKELRADRKTYENAVGKLEKFVIRALAEEIKEFENDKRAVVETKVKLVAEGKAKLAELQSKFIKQSAQAVKEAVSSSLESELTQLKEDIAVARENMFGRRLFEAFASEFAGTHLNENKQIRQLQARIEQVTGKLSQAVGVIESKKAIVESKEKEIRIIKESAERKSRLDDMLKPLNKDKATVMRDLLESVQTDKLQSAYEKYLPAVLNNTTTVKESAPKAAMLTESRVVEVTGDKTAKTAVESSRADDIMSNVFEMKRLAGLK
jgi:predicted DNA-binding protein